MTVKRRWLVLTSLVAVATTAAALVAASTGGASSGKASGSITVWVDAVRLPVAKLYVKTHANVKVNVVTYDGDGNGATTMQTKIQLWNRTGKGWPDVVFSEQANDPVWMSQPPFDFALNLKGVFPASLLTGWPAPSLAQCTVNGRLVCLQDNLAQEVLYVNKKLMGQFGYTVPKTWQEWAALGAKVAKEHPGYIIGNIGESFSHWLYLWPDRCPISQVVAPKTVRINSANVQCTRMAQLLDPLIKSGVVPPESVFTPSFAQKYGGDTDKILFGMGTYGSRSLAVGGTAIIKALDKVIAKARKIAAHLLEASEADIEFANGEFRVAGTDRKKTFAEVALTAYVPHNYPHDELEPGLNENAFYDPANFTYPAGSYICEVEVDPATGVVRIDRFSACDDFGNVINPMIVEGQVHGGVVHGIGQALLEHGIYNEDGQLVTGSYMDYAMPRAADLPSIKVETVKGTPCTHNPLGVKGCGEAGAIGSPAAVINAVTDALWHLGVRNIDIPITPQKVWAILHDKGIN